MKESGYGCVNRPLTSVPTEGEDSVTCRFPHPPMSSRGAFSRNSPDVSLVSTLVSLASEKLRHHHDHRGPGRNRLWTLGSLLLVGMMLLTACGSSESASPSTPTEIPATAAPSPTPTATPTRDEIFAHTSVWHFANDSGYTYDMTIALGEPTRIPESGTLPHPLDRDFTPDIACTVDPKLDIVIPAYWSAEVTTVGFDTPVEMRALFTDVGGAGTSTGEYTGRGVAPFEGDGRVQVAQNFSDGPSCSGFSSTNIYGYGGSSGFSVQWHDPIPEGSVQTSYFFIVVKGYFSPATPQGDAALLDWIVLRPLLAGDLDQPAMVYRDMDGSFMGIYSEKGITLNGKIIEPSIPTPTPPPPSPTPTAVPTQAPNFSVGDTVVTSFSAHLRADATTSSRIIDVLDPATVLSLTGGPERDFETDYVYWQVTVEATGQVGYVNQDAIEPAPGAG